MHNVCEKCLVGSRTTLGFGTDPGLPFCAGLPWPVKPKMCGSMRRSWTTKKHCSKGRADELLYNLYNQSKFEC